MTETTLPVDSATLAISAEMRAQHDNGPHICLDGRRYIGSCLVTDPTCDYLALAILNRFPTEETP
jgi:hypothetical protein